jgi:hypothetical protein
MTGPVVVAFDRSPASMTAARWAADEALERRLPMLLLRSCASAALLEHSASAYVPYD